MFEGGSFCMDQKSRMSRGRGGGGVRCQYGSPACVPRSGIYISHGPVRGD